MTRHTVTLPFPPSINHYWRTGRHGRPYMTKVGKQFKLDAGWLYKAHGGALLTGLVTVTVELNPPDGLRRDLDNCLKIILDGLQGVAYHDDRQVKRINAEMMDIMTGGRALVTVEDYPDHRQL